MKKVSELDVAQLKQDFKNMYNNIGETECYQVLYEILLSANILAEVLIDIKKARHGS